MFKSITGTGIKAKKVVGSYDSMLSCVSGTSAASLAVHDAETAQDNTYTGKAAVLRMMKSHGVIIHWIWN